MRDNAHAKKVSGAKKIREDFCSGGRNFLSGNNPRELDLRETVSRSRSEKIYSFNLSFHYILETSESISCFQTILFPVYDRSCTLKIA